MRVCVLGATGMLGHKFVMNLGEGFDVFSVARSPFSAVEGFGFFKKDRYVSAADLTDQGALNRILRDIKPESVINAIGLTTRKLGAQKASQIVLVNSWLPRVLQEWCMENHARLVHFSTDCVFSGRRGGYREEDTPDAPDLYGRSKLLGEVEEAPALTIRSSIIGREIFGHTELVEWLISQRGKKISGYSRAIYSGVTTNFMVQFVKHELRERRLDHGLFQLASPPISKFELLSRINTALGLNVTILPDAKYVSDKSLDSSRLHAKDPGADKPSWDDMISDFVAEAHLYEGWSKR